MAVSVSVNLNDLLVPGVAGYTPPVGTKKPDGVSLTTLEVASNVALPYMKQKNISVPVSDDLAINVTAIEYSVALLVTDAGIVGDDPIVLTFPAPSASGVRVTVINATTHDINVTWTGAVEPTYLKIFGDSAQEFVQSASAWYKLSTPTVRQGILYL